MRRRGIVVIIAVLASATLAEPVAAQRTTTSIDVGGASIRYADSVTTSVVSLSPAFHARWDRGTISAVGSFSSLANNTRSLDGSMDASLYTRSAHGFVGELTAAAGGATRPGDASTGRWSGLARAHLMTDGGGGYVGAGVGGANDGRTWRPVRQAEAGVWARRAGWTLLASVAPQIVDDTIRFADTEAAMRWERDRVEAGLSGGLRTGSGFVASAGAARNWASASLLVRLTSYAAVVGSAGTYPVDLAQGFPGGRFASVGLRFATPRPRREARSDAPPRELETPRAVTAFALEPAGNGRWTIRLRAPEARSVEINADFTGWKPVALTAGADGAWTATFTIAPGTYQMNLRVDGGTWLAPPGLVAVRDEFGGVFGVLTVR